MLMTAACSSKLMQRWYRGMVEVIAKLQEAAQAAKQAAASLEAEGCGDAATDGAAGACEEYEAAAKAVQAVAQANGLATGADDDMPSVLPAIGVTCMLEDEV